MNATEIATGLHEIRFSDASLKLNALPMNRDVPPMEKLAVDYTVVRPDGFLYASDLLGVVGLELRGCPAVPRICWDNREHQFWDGFQGSFETRNVVVNEPRLAIGCDGRCAAVSLYYVANHVRTAMLWEMRDGAPPGGRLAWDTTITVQNLTGATLKNYGQFFACYHLRNTNYYWDASGEIAQCPPDCFTATATPQDAQRLKAREYHEHALRYLDGAACEYRQYARPVLLSRRQPWFGGGRHAIFVEPGVCAALMTWMSQARDYYIRPPGYDLAPGQSFRARVRHLIAPLESVEELEGHWLDFEQSL